MGGSNPVQGAPSYVPTSDFYIQINKDEIRRNKAVPASVKDEQIVDKMDFRMGDSRMIFKDDIALYDIIATNAANGWKRPIYFAVTVRPEKIGIFKNYLQLEGMALRIVPVLYQSGDNSAGALSMGNVNIDDMYKNLMEKFRWGGFDKHKMFVDESYSPSIQTQQFAFFRLVDALKRNGDKDRALKALERMYEAFPHMNFPIDESYAQRIGLSSFIELGVPEKAKPHVLNLAKSSAEKLKYFSKLIGADDLDGFLTKLDNYSNTIETKRREISMILQQAGGPDNMNKAMSDYAMKSQAEMQKAEAEKELLLKTCKNPDLVNLFDNDIMMAVSTSQQSLELASEIGDEAFKKQVEDIFAPYKIKAKNQPAQKMQVEAPKDTAKKDTVKR
jgi:hypothetical protein